MLTAATDTDRRMGGREMSALSLAVLVVLLSPVILADTEQNPRRGASFGGEEDYPETWKSTLDAVDRVASFAFLLPDDPAANRENVTEVFAAPEGHAVVFRFPPSPLVGEEPVRQEFIEVFQTPWAGGDPASAWSEDVEKSGIIGERVIAIAGVPILAVDPNSPTDLERANPAFLGFVHKGIDIQISGGDDLDLLVGIAKSIIDSNST